MKWAPLSADWLNRIPIIGQDRDGIAGDVAEARDERLAVERLELVEARAVDQASDQLPDRDRSARVERDGRI